MKEILIVGAGSFVGGALRYAVSKWMAACTVAGWPWGTFAVNVAGCLIIGILSGSHWPGGGLSAQTKLLLTTGFCGGFTTFSTFMNESRLMMRAGETATAFLYVAGSIVAGLAAVAAGYWVAKNW